MENANVTIDLLPKKKRKKKKKKKKERNDVTMNMIAATSIKQ